MRKYLTIVLSLMLLLTACGQKQTGPTWQEQYDLGVRYLSEGNYEEAIIAFTAAIEIDPQQADVYLKMGDTYLAMGATDTLRLTQDAYKNAFKLGIDISTRLNEVLVYALQNHPVLSFKAMPSVFSDPIDSTLNAYTYFESVESLGYDVHEHEDKGEMFVSTPGCNIGWMKDSLLFSYAQFRDNYVWNDGETAFDGIFVNSTYADVLSVFGLDPVLYANYDLMLVSNMDTSRSTGWAESARESRRLLWLEYQSKDSKVVYAMHLLFEEDRLIQASFDVLPETLFDFLETVP